MGDSATIAARLDGQRVLLTGATGFVGEALLHLLLTEVPGCQATLLVRGKGSTSAEARVRTLLGKPIFEAAVSADGGIDQLMARRVRVLAGDLANVPPLPPDLDAVVHCAGDVSFDPPVDEGFRTNVLGTRELLERVREVGPDLHYVHVSTAYVAGRRRGSIPEESVSHDVDLEAELAWGLGQRQSVEHRSRSAGVLAGERKKAERAHGRAGLLTAAGATEEARQAVGQGRAGAAGHRTCPQPRLDRLLHVHEGAGGAGGRGPRPRAPRHHRPADHHRVGARAAPCRLDRGLQDGRAADPGLRPRRAAGVPRGCRHHRRHRAGRPCRRGDRGGARPSTRRGRGGVLPGLVGTPQPAHVPHALRPRPRLLRRAPVHRRRSRRVPTARLALPGGAERGTAAHDERARPPRRRQGGPAGSAQRPGPRHRAQARPAGAQAGVPAALPRPLPRVRPGRAALLR